MRKFIVAGGVAIPDGVIGELKRLALTSTDKELEITLKKRVKLTSRQQQAYYFAAVVDYIIDEELKRGNVLNKELLHDEIKNDVMKIHEFYINSKGEERYRLKSLMELETPEFEEKMEIVRAWAAADLGIVIMLPNEGKI